jgi:membrane protease subunit (stomatin/prohibitin family)
MGLMSFIRNELIEIVEWLDDTNYTLVWRFPDEDHELKNGAKLICRQGQAAVLVSEGRMADVFGPGTHTLASQNLPILSTLKGWKYGFESPFKVEVYFINLRQYIDQKWGTANPATTSRSRIPGCSSRRSSAPKASSRPTTSSATSRADWCRISPPPPARAS